MDGFRHRWAAVAMLCLTGLGVAACGGAARSGLYTRLIVSGDQIREDGYRTAYEALTHHRELLVFEGQIGFRGGADDAFASDLQAFTIPLLIVDGDFNLNDAVTALRRIPADRILSIRLYKTSMVPPVYRRPGAEGGVIEVTTR